jgi:HSP20 family protein
MIFNRESSNVDAHIIKVLREMTDMAVRKKEQSHFYNSADDMCAGHWKPNTDIFETDAHVIVRLELANVAREDVSVVVRNGKLHITGVRRSYEGTDSIYFHQMEIHCGEFSKIITLPEAIEHNEITASMQHGILSIYISKQGDVVEIPIMINPDSEL